MKKYILVEGITDVAFLKYICFKNNITRKFNGFKQDNNKHIFNNLIIINLNGQNNLAMELKFLKEEEEDIKFIGIIQDADNNFKKSKENIETAINNSEIDKDKIDIFLTPNNEDKGDLETLLLSTLDKKNIPQLECFKEYKNCLNKHIDISTKTMDKGELYSYTMFSKNGKDYYVPHKSFMYKKKKEYFDTELWDLKKDEFKPIIEFVCKIFQNVEKKEIE